MASNELAFLDIFSPEFKIIQDATREMSLKMFDYMDDIVRQINVEGQRAGLDKDGIKYLTWVLFEDDPHWPPMPDRQRWILKAMRNLVNLGMARPNTEIGSIPPPEDEDKVDRAIIGLAGWCKTGLGPKLKREWDRILIRHALRLPALGYRNDPNLLNERVKEATLKRSSSIPLNRFLIPVFFYVFE